MFTQPRFTAGTRTKTVLAAALALSAVSVVKAQTISITDIANTTSTEFYAFLGTPTINNTGTVAFGALRDAGGQGIYTATNTGSFTTVARDTSTEFGGSGFVFGTPSISNNGLVAFSAKRDAGGQGIYTATDSSGFTRLASTDDVEYASFGNVRINTAGKVAFSANRDNGEQGVYAGTNSSNLVRIADTDDGRFTGFVDASISNTGEVAFAGFSPYGAYGVYRTGGTDYNGIIAIAQNNRPEFSQFGLPSINASGLSTFFAYNNRGGTGIYTAITDADFTTIANSDGPYFSDFTEPALNNLGTVAFYALAKAGAGDIYGTGGIYAQLSSSSSPTAIIRTGDALFGSTVSSLSFFQGLADDSNTLTFQYSLQNGVSGIARANIGSVTAAPEPGSVGLFVLGGIGVAFARRKRSSVKL